MAGRPKFKIDYQIVEKLASIMCTHKEIASFLGCDERTLQRDSEFCRVYKKGQETGKMSLRRTQWKLAEKNVTMAIWLGKQYLGQSEKIISENTNANGVLEDISSYLKENKDNE